jgi:hypothetical protein
VNPVRRPSPATPDPEALDPASPAPEADPHTAADPVDTGAPLDPDNGHDAPLDGDPALDSDAASDADAALDGDPAGEQTPLLGGMSRRSTAALAVSGLLVVLMCGAGAAIVNHTLDQEAPPAAADSPAGDATVAPSPTVADERASGDGHLISDGQWLVGDDIDSGTFATTVPADSPGCAWERADADDGSAASLLDSGTAEPGEALAITIKPTDRVFRTTGCGTWHAIAE